MSNYTAKRRSGGGPSGQPPLLHIITADAFSGTQIGVSWNGTIDTIPFTAGDFVTFPGAISPTGITPFTADTIGVDFGETVTGEEGIQYVGTHPGLLTPDSKTFG